MFSFTRNQYIKKKSEPAPKVPILWHERLNRREILLDAIIWLAFFSILAGSSVGIIFQASAEYTNLERNKAKLFVASVAGNFASIFNGALFTTQTVRSFIEEGPTPSHSEARKFFLGAAKALRASSSAIDNIQLAPYGHVACLDPFISSRFNFTDLFLHPLDLFSVNSPIKSRPYALLSLTTQTVRIQGPRPLFGVDVADLGLLARAPLFVRTSSAADPWANDFQWPSLVKDGPNLGPYTEVSDCSPTPDPTTGRALCDTDARGDGKRFWGFFTVVVVWPELLKLANVASLTDQGFRWSISRSADTSDGTGAINWVFAAASDGAMSADPDTGAIVVVVHVETTAWAFTIDRKDNWSPVWKDGLIAGAFIISAGLASIALYLAKQNRAGKELIRLLRAGTSIGVSSELTCLLRFRIH